MAVVVSPVEVTMTIAMDQAAADTVVYLHQLHPHKAVQSSWLAGEGAVVLAVPVQEILGEPVVAQ
jgi:hypothetical protein